jgi:hypothetical protein
MPAIDPADTVERARARIGSMLKDKWRLDDLIGSGGMASVFRATHRNGNRVAIKMLHLELSLDSTIRRRFLREGYAGNSVDHRDVVRALDEDIAEDGSAFLVLELLEGETLQELLDRGGPLPVARALAIAHALLDVLAAAHAKGIVHRDVKPDNVFLTEGGVVKVLDFGIAQVRDASRAASLATAAGSAMGTPAFMAPEQALGHVEEVDARTDVWAVGGVVFTMLSGRHVHVARTQMEQLVSAATKRAPPLADVVPGVPPEVAATVDRALAFERGARWPDARAMQAAVAALQVRATSEPALQTATIVTGVGAMPMAPTLHAGASGVRAESAASHPGLVAPVRRTRVRAGVLLGAAALAIAATATYYAATQTGEARVSRASPPSAASAPAATAPPAGSVDPQPPPPAASGAPEVVASGAPPAGRSAPTPPSTRGVPAAAAGSAPAIVRTIGSPAPSPRPSSWLDQR